MNSTSDGLERRQFMHVDDAAAALVAVLEHWEEAFLPVVPPSSSGLETRVNVGASLDESRRVLDLSSGLWLRLLDVGALMSAEAHAVLGIECPLLPSSVPSLARPELEPVLDAAIHSMLPTQWYPRTAYPYSAPLIAESYAGAAQGIGSAEAVCVAATGCATIVAKSEFMPVTAAPKFGSIGIRDGIRHLLEFQMQL